MSTCQDSILPLLDEKNLKEAHDEFAATFLPSAKRILAEMPQTFPKRFAKIDDWCAWVKKFNVLATAAEKALTGDDAAAASKALVAVRAHFYALHKETGLLNAADQIYAFRSAVQSPDAPSAAILKALRTDLDKAPTTAKIKANPEAFAAARARWARKVDAALADDAINAAELTALRTVTESFYRAFGTVYE